MVIDKIDPAYLYLDCRFGKSRAGLKGYCTTASILPLMCITLIFLVPYTLVYEVPDNNLTNHDKTVVVTISFLWLASVYYLACFYKILTWELPQVVNWIKQDGDHLLIKPVFGNAIRIALSEYHGLAFERLPRRFWHYPFSYIRKRINQSNQCYKLKYGDDRFLYVIKDVAEGYRTEQKLKKEMGST